MLSSTACPDYSGKSRFAGKTFLQTLFFLLLITQICFAQVNWTKYEGNPILTGYSGYDWNTYLYSPCILFNADYNRFEMWFSGFGSLYAGGPGFTNIGFAVSNDGIHWDMHPEPVITPSAGSWDSISVAEPFVIRQNGQYEMWYSSYQQYPPAPSKIGYATSPDGITWTKYEGNPILEAGSKLWETGGVRACCVIPIDGGYNMWYTGYKNIDTLECIGYATSTDGIYWQRDTLNNPVIVPGDTWEWDDGGIILPKIIVIDSSYYSWFGGVNSSTGLFQLGLAVSKNGILWEKDESNPVLKPSPLWGGEWDNAGVQSGSVLLIGDTLYMWYNGFYEPIYGGKGHASIGLAKSLFEVVSIQQQNTPRTEFLLSQNYPNPFNPSTKIKYSIQNSSQVVIKLFDILGNEIETLVNEEKPIGTYELTWNAANLPSGVYFYRIHAGDFVKTKKMILLR